MTDTIPIGTKVQVIYKGYVLVAEGTLHYFLREGFVVKLADRWDYDRVQHELAKQLNPPGVQWGIGRHVGFDGEYTLGLMPKSKAELQDERDIAKDEKDAAYRVYLGALTRYNEAEQALEDAEDGE